MILLVAKQIGLHVIAGATGLAIGAYGPRYINGSVIKIIGDLIAGGL